MVSLRKFPEPMQGGSPDGGFDNGRARQETVPLATLHELLPMSIQRSLLDRCRRCKQDSIGTTCACGKSGCFKFDMHAPAQSRRDVHKGVQREA